MAPMTGSRDESVDEQAAAWLMRLRHRSVSTAELEEFAQWRRIPGHAEAYDRVQAFWSDSARLSSDPDIQRALHGGSWKRVREPGRYVTHPVMALAVLAVAVILVIGILTRPSAVSRSYQTAVGERSSLHLADGSGVDLDTDSHVSATFNEEERRVTLSRGQAFFRVAHALERPFVVDAGDGITITATGTQFDVRRTRDRVVVALVSGAVTVRRNSEELARMKPGSVVEIAVDDGTIATSRTVAETTSWRAGHLSFDETPLVEAVAEVNRYTDAKFVIHDATKGAEPVSGEFSIDDPDGFGQAVNALMGGGTVGR